MRINHLNGVDKWTDWSIDANNVSNTPTQMSNKKNSKNTWNDVYLSYQLSDHDV